MSSKSGPSARSKRLRLPRMSLRRGSVVVLVCLQMWSRLDRAELTKVTGAQHEDMLRRLNYLEHPVVAPKRW